MSTQTTAYKAFDDDWTCRDFRYKVGETYEHSGEIEICAAGFHACTVPFNCWDYYPHSTTLAQVTFEGGTKTDADDSKIVGAKITIEASLSLPEWIKKQAETILDLCKSAKGTLADSGHAAATGDSGHAAATGDSGHAAATGYRGHAAATGYSGHAAATGKWGHAAATGKWGCAVSLGIAGKAEATEGYITLAHWQYIDCEWQLINVQTRKVGKGGLKPDTLYTRDPDTGKFVKCEG